MTGYDELVDRSAIAEVVAGLAHAQDDRDWTTLHALFADRVTLDLSTHYYGTPPTTMAAADLVALARRGLTGFDCTHHAASNLRTRLAGDEARSRAHMVAYHHLSTGPGAVDFCTMRGYWELELRKAQGQWRIERWSVVRTAPWEGSPQLYDLAANAS
ncbi:nuclear transport factor 2 family protein [Mycobacterium sp. WMMD1722]|uniref:nuclear transport factor 2 family protein n=1 Tax=Mycobacterium sp. WMMD1722 TaxID=3404117 RepID=UPI003BF4992C